MLKILSICSLMIFWINLFAQTGKQSATNKSKDDLTQLSTLNAQFIQDFLHNDTVAHNKIIYKDFVCITGNGTVVNRDDYMKGWSHGYDPSVYKSLVMQNELIRVFNNTALIRAETPYAYISNGKEISGTTIYTDTYIKLDGRWWCVQAQLTPKK